MILEMPRFRREGLVPLRRRLLAAALLGSAAALGQTAAPAGPPTIKPGENLVVEGVPPIPAGSPTRSGGTPSSGRPLLELASDPAEMLDLARFGNTNQAHLVKTRAARGRR